MTKRHPSIIQFTLPEALACPLPTEERGIRRDQVRLMVSEQDGEQISHHLFQDLADVLKAGDVLVVNTSATVPAALPIQLPQGDGRLHLSNQLEEGHWLVEIRTLAQNNTRRWRAGTAGQVFALPGGARLRLLHRYYQNREALDLWVADIDLPTASATYLRAHALPVKYLRVDQNYPLQYYQTYFGQQPGSTEMPSAARGFTPELVDKLLHKGVQIVPILLHTGISSLETDEEPYPEYMEVSALSAQRINLAKAKGQRIIAVGTTAIRALESAVDERGQVQAYRGNTSLYIKANHQLRMASGLLTGFHEPEASHLHMLQALASRQHLQRAYQTALREQYHWHEFGDLHLILDHPKPKSWWNFSPEYLAKPIDLPRQHT